MTHYYWRISRVRVDGSRSVNFYAHPRNLANRGGFDDLVARVVAGVGVDCPFGELKISAQKFFLVRRARGRTLRVKHDSYVEVVFRSRAEAERFFLWLRKIWPKGRWLRA